MNRPIIYYALAFILGSCACLIISSIGFIQFILFTAAFLVCMFFTTDIRYFTIIMCFYILGFINFKLYFDYLPSQNAKIRITQKTKFGYKGTIDGRNIYVSGRINCSEGQILKVYGTFKKNIQYDSGILGSYKIKKYSKCKNDLISNMYLLRENIYEAYKNACGDEDASVIVSLCFGDTSHISNLDKDNFKKVGVIHAISVSGFHIAAIYKIIELLFGYKPAIIISFFYVIFTGSQSSTIRAFIMILILKLSKKLYRKYDKYSSLAFAALIISIVKPYSFLDAGFILSFLSTLGIMIYYNKFLRVLYKLPVKLNESVSITLSSQIFSAPYAIMIFKSFGSGFLLGNILLLPIYTFIVILGNLSLVFLKLKLIFKLLAFLTHFFMTVSRYVLNVLLLIVPDLSEYTYLEGILLLIIYTCLILYKKGYKRVKYIPLAASFCLFISQYSFFPEVTYVNLNKDQSVLISYKNRRVLIANYDKSNKVYDLKEEYKVTDVITNIEKEKYYFNLENFGKLAVADECLNNKNYINIWIKSAKNNYYLGSKNELYCSNNTNEKYYFINVPQDKESSYIIIFGKLFRIK